MTKEGLKVVPPFGHLTILNRAELKTTNYEQS